MSTDTPEELREDPLHESTETENKTKNEEREEVQSDLLHDLPDWLQEFRENVVDESTSTEPWGPRKNEYSRLHQQKSWKKESLWLMDVGASMHMVSRRDLNSAELDTVKVSKNPTVVMTANGEVFKKTNRFGFIRDSNVSRRYTSSTFTQKIMQRLRV